MFYRGACARFSPLGDVIRVGSLARHPSIAARRARTRRRGAGNPVAGPAAVWQFVAEPTRRRRGGSTRQFRNIYTRVLPYGELSSARRCPRAGGRAGDPPPHGETAVCAAGTAKRTKSVFGCRWPPGRIYNNTPTPHDPLLMSTRVRQRQLPSRRPSLALSLARSRVRARPPEDDIASCAPARDRADLTRTP